MASSNFDVDFIDNDDAGKPNVDDKAKRDHQVKDVLHKIFVIHSAYHHSKGLEESDKKENNNTRKGALSG